MIFADIKRIFGNATSYTYITHEDLYEYKNGVKTANVIGITVTILDADVNKIKVKIPVAECELPDGLTKFDNILLPGLEGVVYGVSKKDSTYVDLKISFRAENIMKGD